MDGAPETRERQGPGWRQPLSAGLLLGLALGCGWLARWTPRWYPRLLFALLAGVLALMGLALLVAASESWPPAVRLQRAWQERLGAASFPFFAAVVLLALAALATGNNLLYLLVSGLIAALLVSGATAALNLSGLELTFDMSTEVFAGREIPVPFELRNTKTWWPAYSLTVQASSRGARESATMAPIYFAHLPRGGRGAGSGRLTFPRRGYYESTAFVCATRFPFGLLQKRRRFQERRAASFASVRDGIWVYPKPIEGLRLPAEVRERAHASAAARRVGEGQELHRIRRHVQGEPIRRVDWKASARTDALQVREYLDEQAPRVRLHLVRSPTAAPADCEAALSECAGWAIALAEQPILVEFIGEYGSADHRDHSLVLRAAPAAEQRRPILEYLARVEVSAVPEPPAEFSVAADFDIVVG